MVGKILNRNYLGKLVKNAGKKLELNGFTGACIQLKGDWEFLDQALRFPRWDNKESMCWLCKASNHGVDLLWTGEGWKTTLQSHEDYVTDRVRKGFPLPVLFLIAALRTEGVMIDSMHAVDQGMACHILANILFEMMRSGAFGGTNISDQLNGLREALDEWYRRNKDRYRIQGKLTIDRIKTSSDWPKLKAKAAATRHLAFFCREMLDKHGAEGDTPQQRTHNKRVQSICKLLCRYYEILSEQPRFLSDAAKQELRDLSLYLRQIYVNLSREALDKQQRLWKMTAKVHLFEHLCQDQVSWGNPVFWWCYSDEDLQKIVKEIAITCHVSSMDYMTLYKWLIHVFD